MHESLLQVFPSTVANLRPVRHRRVWLVVLKDFEDKEKGPLAFVLGDLFADELKAVLEGLPYKHTLLAEDCIGN